MRSRGGRARDDTRDVRPSRAVVFDLECYPGRWCVGFHGIDHAGKLSTKIVETRNDLERLLKHFAEQGRTLIGYNSDRFDVPLICAILGGIDPHALAQQIIRNDRLPPKLAKLPEFPCDHIDLSARLRRVGKFPSLKLVAANLGRPILRELPFDPETALTDEQWEAVKQYNAVDLAHTWDLLQKLAPELQALTALSQEQGQDLRSVSTPQVVERVFLKAYDHSHNRDPVRIGQWREVRYRLIEGVVRPKTWDAADWFDRIVKEPIPMVPRGDRSAPAVPAAKFTVGNLVLSVGSGGLHSVDCPRVYYATKRHRLISVDVQSFYPSLISTKGIAPAAYCDTGRETYRAIVERRLAVKRRKGPSTFPWYRRVGGPIQSPRHSQDGHSNHAPTRSVCTAAAVASLRARFSHSYGINVSVASLGRCARTCERYHGLFSPGSRPTASSQTWSASPTGLRARWACRLMVLGATKC